MSDDVKLEPCPSGHSETTRDNNNIYGAWWVKCKTCSWRAAGDTEAEAITAWNTRTAANADVDRLVEAAQTLIAQMSDTYKARNSKRMSIEADDGEKCYIVHSDDIFSLQSALDGMGEKA